jgi:hypothetical protein
VISNLFKAGLKLCKGMEMTGAWKKKGPHPPGLKTNPLAGKNNLNSQKPQKSLFGNSVTRT